MNSRGRGTTAIEENDMTIRKILLVDDSKTELHYLSDLLVKRGYAVRTAENGDCLLYTSPSPRD